MIFLNSNKVEGRITMMMIQYVFFSEMIWHLRQLLKYYEMYLWGEKLRKWQMSEFLRKIRKVCVTEMTFFIRLNNFR